MDINTLKEYVRINRRRLSPKPSDCNDPSVMTGFASKMRDITQGEKSANEFLRKIHKYGKEKFHLHHPTVTGFLLLCLPLLLAVPTVSKAFSADEGIARLVGYILTFALLIGRMYIQGMAQWLELNEIAQAANIGLLILCYLLGDVFGLSLFGTKAAWVLVFVLLGLAVTIAARKLDMKRLGEENEFYDNGVAVINGINSDVKEANEYYKRLGDKADAQLRSFIKERGLSVTPSRRVCWFDYKREYDKYYFKVNERALETETDFLKQLAAGKETVERESAYKDEWNKVSHLSDSEYINAIGSGKLTEKEWLETNLRLTGDKPTDITEIETVIHSQSFGWSDYTAEQAAELLNKGMIYPYYHLEIPEFIHGLRYSVMRHTWDITKHVTVEQDYIETKHVASDAQLEFDNQMEIEESIKFSKYGGLTKMSMDTDLAPHVDRYLEKKRDARASLGSKEIKLKRHRTTHKDLRSTGDEIGALLIYAPDGELVGAYCGRTVQSIKFTSNCLKGVAGTDIDMYSQPQGLSQQALHRYKYC